MKRIALLLCMVLMLSGCSAFTGQSNITGLLSSPIRSQTESEIVKVISEYLGENITLRYSKLQGYDAPVQLMDIDGDKTDEAVVFYYALNKGTNIRVALLSFEDEKWKIKFDKEGLGSDVFYFETARFEGVEGKQILVGYLSPNISENFFVTYFTPNEICGQEYSEVCSTIYTGDVTGDGFDEVTLAASTAEDMLKLQVLCYDDQAATLKIAGAKSISRPGIQILKLESSRTAEGKRALYIDYCDSEGKMYTDGFVVTDSPNLKSCFAGGTVARSWKYEQKLCSTDVDHDGVLEIPETVYFEGQPQNEEESPVVFMQWTDYSETDAEAKRTGVYDAKENLFMPISAGWVGLVHTVYNGSSWQVVRTEDDKPLVTVTKLEADQKVESRKYLYTVTFDTQSWSIEFAEDEQLPFTEYIINNTVLLD